MNETSAPAKKPNWLLYGSLAVVLLGAGLALRLFLTAPAQTSSPAWTMTGEAEQDGVYSVQVVTIPFGAQRANPLENTPGAEVYKTENFSKAKPVIAKAYIGARIAEIVVKQGDKSHATTINEDISVGDKVKVRILPNLRVDFIRE